MRRLKEFFRGLTAGDVMSRAAVVLTEGMSVAAAARLLLERRRSAAPVIDAPGRCVGVLAAADLLAWAAEEDRVGEGGPAAGCVWCDWQVVGEGSPRRDEVRRHMTHDPLLVTSETRLAAVADALLGPRPRPVVVVDEGRRPLGVVSRRGVLAALATASRRGGGRSHRAWQRRSGGTPFARP